ncbi:MAG TPA: serine/threonine-protein kinase [Vicinamibacteria bacterium]|nr:serine/threonine-protein kinase [Vicinamibacteria bacterium]
MSTVELIRPRSASDSSLGALISRGMPPDLLREAGRRLELFSLVVAAAFAFALAINPIGRLAGWYALPRPRMHAGVSAVMILVSVMVAWTARKGLLTPVRLIDLGLVYEVIVAFGVAIGDNLTPLSAERPLETISWLCVVIAMFPLVVPARPAKTILASLAAASTWPLAYAIGVRMGNPPAAVTTVVLNSLENYLAAILALLASLVLGRLGAAVQKAREMGSYELVERIDSGGMGEVWRARHRMLARPAAIKLIRPDRLGVAGGRAAENLVLRFEREAQATAALHSPHTVDLYDFGVTREGTFYYVMEILDGLDLESLVRRFGPVPAERAAHLLVHACDSLDDAHFAGLVHRDIKPANLYACRRGREHDFLKVLDFGLVKSSWADATSDPALSRESAIAGTPAYLAPELILGERAIDGRVDIYGLGCVAYWLVSGQRVFEGATSMELVLHHVQTPPVPPSRRAGIAVPSELEDLILTCLEKDPARRPTSARELARLLEATGLPGRWTPERAREWWDAHVPPAPAAAR